MKLTEKQLAELFQNNIDKEDKPGYLYDSADVSAERLSTVEQIADDSRLSAAYQVINKLDEWSEAVGQSVELKLRPAFISSVFSWFKPMVATAAVVTAVYFITPEFDKSNSVHTQSDIIMFSASFDEKGDRIDNMSFESKSADVINDEISKSSFG